MENSRYKSLAQKLIQNGILPDNDSKEINFFETPAEEEVEEEKTQENKNKKRINKLDYDMIAKDSASNAINFKTVALLKILKRFVDSKQNTNKRNLKIENLFFKFFPKLYRAKLVKDALNQLLELNIDAKSLLDKTIPYGENDSRYKDLIKYINCANEIQINLKKKI